MSESAPFDKNRFKIARMFKLRDCDIENLSPGDQNFLQGIIDTQTPLDSSAKEQMDVINGRLSVSNPNIKKGHFIKQYNCYLKECELLEKERFKELYVNDPIFGNIALEPWERVLIDTYEIQRLRGFCQLGMAHLVYPNATHTRFAHVLGTKYLTDLMLKKVNVRVEGEPPVKLEEFLEKEFSNLFKAVAILHDVGHGPFSHAGEFVLKNLNWGNHEVFSELMIDHGVKRALHAIDIDSSEVVEIIKGKGCDEAPLRLIRDLISSPLDIDRMEYLLRDTHNTGVHLGYFDINRLIASLAFIEREFEGEKRYHFVIREKGFSAFESFVLARDWMYDRVYFHKTVRSAEKMLQRAIYEKIETEDWNKEEFCAVYLSMNDKGFLQWLENSDSELVYDLCTRIRNRRLYVKAYETTLGALSIDARDKVTELRDSKEPFALNKWIEDSFSEEEGIVKGDVIIDNLPNRAKQLREIEQRIPILKVENGRFFPESIAYEPVAEPIRELLRIRSKISEKILVFSPREKRDKIKRIFEEKYLLR